MNQRTRNVLKSTQPTFMLPSTDPSNFIFFILFLTRECVYNDISMESARFFLEERRNKCNVTENRIWNENMFTFRNYCLFFNGFFSGRTRGEIMGWLIYIFTLLLVSLERERAAQRNDCRSVGRRVNVACKALDTARRRKEDKVY